MSNLRSFVVLFSGVVLAALFLFRFADSGLGSRSVQAAAETGSKFENYDIRLGDSAEAKRAEFRRMEGSSDGLVRSGRERISSAAAELRRSKGLIIENGVLNMPEVISPFLGGPFLSAASTKTRAAILRDYLTANAGVLGLDHGSLDQLSVAADYTNPDGNLSFVVLRQSLDGLPIFAGEIKAAFTRKNEIVRVINNLAPGVKQNSYATRFGTQEDAIANAMRFIPSEAIHANDTTAEKMLFPIDYGIIRPAWRVLFYLPNDAFYVIVDAEDGTLLWRKNIAEKQTLNATFGVYGTNSGLMMTSDSPTPATPFTCAAPVGCTEPPVIGRTLFTLVGNEAPNTFNNLGWIPDTGLPVRKPANPNITDGNNAETGIDRDGTQGVDPQGHAVGNPTRVFNFAYNPAPGNPPPPDNPTPPNPQTYPPTPFQQGVVTHAFYTVNRWHDAAYKLGFTEQAGNFQHFNFGRGGSEGDRLSFEVQDGSGTNGANFATPADGGRGRMQMFLWTGPTPDRDGTLDSTVVVHELTHGISGRLHGNATGLSSNMSRGMGEGWSDFYASALLSEPTDSLLGVHAAGGYITHQIVPGFEANHYYGIRRFPLAIKAFVGPNGLPHNPLTLGYLNANCNTLIGTTTTNPNSAYPRGPIGTNTCDQIHNMGEVWSTILWEVRVQLMLRHGLGLGEGNRRALQYVMDGMKLSPLNPTMIQARDSILLAIQATDANDLRWAWRGFAIRGIGSSAAVINPGTGSNNTVVTEAFDIPVQYRRPVRADYDGDRRADISVFRPSDRNWYLNRSTAGFAAVTWGLSTDIPVPADYDGDNKADIAVHRRTDDGTLADFFIIRSSDSTFAFVNWGLSSDIPVVEDYDGDRKADVAIFRPSTRSYWVLQSSDGAVHYSGPFTQERPVTGDFNGDGRADYGAFSDGVWLIRIISSTGTTSQAQVRLINWGLNSDKLVPADYDGDGIDDIAIYRPSNGTWYIRKSSGGNMIIPFGISTDRPVPGDYDGDGRADIAVYRDGTWWINASTSGIQVAHFGLPEDLPTPASNNQ